ncbi:MAG: hypothetical protein ACE5JJ_12460 [Nitrospinota bacterium]
MINHAPFCVPCGQFTELVRNGVVICLGGEPALYRVGDEYRCPACDRLTVAGLGAPFRREEDWSPLFSGVYPVVLYEDKGRRG